MENLRLKLATVVLIFFTTIPLLWTGSTWVYAKGQQVQANTEAIYAMQRQDALDSIRAQISMVEELIRTREEKLVTVENEELKALIEEGISELKDDLNVLYEIKECFKEDKINCETLQ